MRPSSFLSTASVCVLSATSALAGGLVTANLWPRHASAEPIGSTSTIYVPAEGVVFRALDGRPIARLARDAYGGFLELYDDRRASALRFPARAVPVEAPTVPPSAFVIDDEDPWTRRTLPATGADPSGFYNTF